MSQHPGHDDDVVKTSALLLMTSEYSDDDIGDCDGGREYR